MSLAASSSTIKGASEDGRIYRNYRTTSSFSQTAVVSHSSTTSTPAISDVHHRIDDYIKHLCAHILQNEPSSENEVARSVSSLPTRTIELCRNLYGKTINVHHHRSTGETSSYFPSTPSIGDVSNSTGDFHHQSYYYYKGQSDSYNNGQSSMFHQYLPTSLIQTAQSVAASSSSLSSASSFTPSFSSSLSPYSSSPSSWSYSSPSFINIGGSMRTSTVGQFLNDSAFLVTNSHVADEEDSYLDPNLKITLIVLLSLMIVMTVIGNILVCLSVILVRKLRHPSNYLLVSLAISDLCVAILVMPLALQYELSQSWRLSNAICDLWVSFDVTCCTSSILNLCTISIDRYLAITKPLTYGVRRTTKRILSFIVAVWVASCLISIPPVLILGNEHGGYGDQARCEVSQNLGYQLYATLGAFYIPLLVMIVMYYKIYMAAKRVVDAELRDQRPSCTSSISMRTLSAPMHHSKLSLLSNRFYSMRKATINSQQSNNDPFDEQESKQNKIRPIKMDQNQNCLELVTSSNATPEELEHLNPDNKTAAVIIPKNHHKNKHKTRTSKTKKNKTKKNRTNKFYCCCCCCGYNDGQTGADGQFDNPIQQQQQHCHLIQEDVTDASLTMGNVPPTTVPTTTTMMVINSTADGRLTTTTTSTMVSGRPNSDNSAIGHKHLNGHHKLPPPPQPQLQTQQSIKSNASSAYHESGQPAQNFYSSNNDKINNLMLMKNQPKRRSFNTQHSRNCTDMNSRQQRASNALRERKASVTLGIIMTAFTVCWLPFFILALLRPFSASVMQIPRYVNSIALWLGYANSMLNPIIYVTFHQDFRRAFKYLLCLQCRSMGTRLRAEAYISQYGQKKQQHQLTPATSSAFVHQYQQQQHQTATPSSSSNIQQNIQLQHLEPKLDPQQQLYPPKSHQTGRRTSSNSNSIVHFQIDDNDEAQDSMKGDENGQTIIAPSSIEKETEFPVFNEGNSTGNTIKSIGTEETTNIKESKHEHCPSTTMLTNTTTTTNAMMNLIDVNINLSTTNNDNINNQQQDQIK